MLIHLNSRIESNTLGVTISRGGTSSPSNVRAMPDDRGRKSVFIVVASVVVSKHTVMLREGSREKA